MLYILVSVTARVCTGLTVLMFLAALPLRADEALAGFIRGSDSRDNTVILELIATSDAAAAVRYAHLLCEREDPSVGDILTGLYRMRNPGNDHLREILIRTVIEAVFFDDSGHVEAEAADLQRDELALLQENLGSFTDSGLRAALIFLLPEDLEGRALKVLLMSGRYSIGLAEQHDGFFPGDTPLEVAAFLKKAAGSDAPQVMRQVGRIYELSRDQAVTALAKRSLRIMNKKEE